MEMWSLHFGPCKVFLFKKGWQRIQGLISLVLLHGIGRLVINRKVRRGI